MAKAKKSSSKKRATKKAAKRKGAMTGKFPSKENFVTRCKRIARRAGTSVMDCERLFKQAQGKRRGKK